MCRQVWGAYGCLSCCLTLRKGKNCSWKCTRNSFRFPSIVSTAAGRDKWWLTGCTGIDKHRHDETRSSAVRPCHVSVLGFYPFFLIFMLIYPTCWRPFVANLITTERQQQKQLSSLKQHKLSAHFKLTFLYSHFFVFFFVTLGQVSSINAYSNGGVGNIKAPCFNLQTFPFTALLFRYWQNGNLAPLISTPLKLSPKYILNVFLLADKTHVFATIWTVQLFAQTDTFLCTTTALICNGQCHCW